MVFRIAALLDLFLVTNPAYLADDREDFHDFLVVTRGFSLPLCQGAEHKVTAVDLEHANLPDDLLVTRDTWNLDKFDIYVNP